MALDLIPQQTDRPVRRRISPLLAVNVTGLLGGALVLFAMPREHWWLAYALCFIGAVALVIHLIRHPAQDLNAFPPGFVFEPTPEVGPSDPAALGVNGAETS
ncbi:MAG TPA: hypothetical protein VFH27_04335, partial [Longimicrobiaceae bacterium]|nr:hypothetical protein [Longimicrobiaceae bacterium]